MIYTFFFSFTLYSEKRKQEKAKERKRKVAGGEPRMYQD